MNLEKQIANKKPCILVVAKDCSGVEQHDALLRANNYTPRDETRLGAVTGEWYQWWDKHSSLPAPNTPFEQVKIT
jgi:hypothetical protein